MDLNCETAIPVSSHEITTIGLILLDLEEDDDVVTGGEFRRFFIISPKTEDAVEFEEKERRYETEGREGGNNLLLFLEIIETEEEA